MTAADQPVVQPTTASSPAPQSSTVLLETARISVAPPPPDEAEPVLTASERIRLLVDEWMFISKSVEWNINIYDRYRAALFTLASAAAGLQLLQLGPDPVAGSLPLGFWVIAPFVGIAIVYRMLSQFHLVNVKNFRLSRIEEAIEQHSGSKEYFRLNAMIRRDNRRVFSNPYIFTQMSMFALAAIGIIYAESNGFTGLSQLGLTQWGIPAEWIYRVFAIAYMAALIIQSALVWRETGNPSVEKKLAG